MTASIEIQDLKVKLLELLRKDKSFRIELKEYLADSFTTREETNAILNEIKLLRQESNKRMEQFEQSMKELRQDFNKRMEQFERRIEQFERRMDQFERRMDQFEQSMKELRQDFNKRMEQFDIKLSALGRRWGYETEAAIRNALKGLYEEKFKVKVERWEYYDSEGLVFGAPSMIDVDVAITNSEHTLIEIKAHVGKSDVAELLRIGELYEKVTKVKPSLVFITPFIDDKALDFAYSKKIKVYSEKEL